MQYISSDTSVWIDFSIIRKIELPFRLPYTFIMNRDAVENELLSPPKLGAELIAYGLVPVEITIEEFNLAQRYGTLYPRLSTFDRIALAIAKERNIVLLTGDGALRKAALQEEISIMGTLGILDQLWSEGRIDADELSFCLKQLIAHNGGTVRLPRAELERRLAMLPKP